ncbi:MAG: cell division protein ZapB [Treponema sp.]|nr:cell division protein ZapB [Treponema sp.]
MVSLEQVKLLESKVTRAIDYVKTVTEENSSLKGKLDSYQKRIEELEILIQQFKEDQGRIEDGILSALDRLNQFEDALEKTLAADPAVSTIRDPSPTEKPAEKKEGLPKKEKEVSGSTLEREPHPGSDLSGDAKSSEELDIF